MRVANSAETLQYYISMYDMDSFMNNDMLACLQVFRFAPYTNVYLEGDEQHMMYFLVEGQVQCSHYHQSGKLAVFAVNDPFAAIGDFEIFTERKVKSNVITIRNTTLLGIERVFVDRYGQDDPRFLHFLLDQLRDKLYRTNNLQMSHVLPLISRLAVYLLSRPTNEDDRVTLPGKEELASMMGATSRHLNRVIKELVEEGAISTEYPFMQILDRSALEAYAES